MPPNTQKASFDSIQVMRCQFLRMPFRPNNDEDLPGELVASILNLSQRVSVGHYHLRQHSLCVVKHFPMLFFRNPCAPITLMICKRESYIDCRPGGLFSLAWQ